ncbi:hypothetical protein RDWZM_000129 [Blomia tropicalis]|uniref:Peptidase S1 domain-containing protein n=1 Tax=Blomia tropicalis TaxID=40697 RepID=A0A9Q0MA03_BLOTA|nr:hypothetical protein RDWZM_000129 [Blomia tropicalis]
MQVKYDTLFLNKLGTTIPVLKTIVHEQYRQQRNDVGLVQTLVPMLLNVENAKSIDLAPKDYDPTGSVNVSGWGEIVDKSETLSLLLNVAEIPVYPRNKCAGVYPLYITTEVFCTYADGKDICKGDSGGPVTDRTSDRETGDEVRFIAISKAYATLTDAKAYQNWLDYGNPDGPGVTILGIALPAWIISNENAYIILALYGSLLLIGLPLWVNWWWSKCLSSSDSIAMPSSDQKGSKIIPETIQMFMWTLYKKPSMNIATILNTIAASLEFNPLFNCNVQTRKSDNLHIPELIQRLPVAYQINREKVKGELSPLQYPYAIKTRALLLAHLNRLELSSRSLQFDLRYIQPKSLHVIQCFINCIVQLTFFAISGRIEQRPSLETLEHAIKLSQLIVQALAFDKSSLLQIPHLTEEIIRNRKFNVQTIRQLASLSDVERRHLLRRLNDDQYLDVCNMIGSLPLLDIDAQCGPMDESIDQEDMFHPRIITTKSLVAVYVTITRKPMSQLFGSTFTENDKFDESPAFISFSGDDGINFKEKFNDKSTIDPKQIISNSLNKCTNQVHCPLFNGIKHENWWIYISTDRKKLLQHQQTIQIYN